MVAGKPIQEQFGEMLIATFADFARKDIKSAAELEADEFAHVSDPDHRRDLARVCYGARWLYKLGLALLVRDEERAAHIRAQVVDYASVVEGLLSDSVAHAIKGGHCIGAGYLYSDPDKQQYLVNWRVKDIDAQVGRRSFWWLIRIAGEFGIVQGALLTDLQYLRQDRNDVHLRQSSAVGSAGYLSQSRRAFDLMCRTIVSTKAWKKAHP